jgi:hypothetical protein
MKMWAKKTVGQFHWPEVLFCREKWKGVEKIVGQFHGDRNAVALRFIEKRLNNFRRHFSKMSSSAT